MSGNHFAELSQRENETRFSTESTNATDECSICKRALEYDADRNFWRFDDQFGEPAEVTSVKHGDYVCGPKCLSQYIFNESTERERDDMRLMAQMCDAWLKVEYTRRRWSFWSYSKLSINPGMLDDEINSLLSAFGMEDGENPPAWY